MRVAGSNPVSRSNNSEPHRGVTRWGFVAFEIAAVGFVNGNSAGGQGERTVLNQRPRLSLLLLVVERSRLAESDGKFDCGSERMPISVLQPLARMQIFQFACFEHSPRSSSNFPSVHSGWTHTDRQPPKAHLATHAELRSKLAIARVRPARRSEKDRTRRSGEPNLMNTA